MATTPKGRTEPIYEKLGPNECLIINRDRNGILVACNEHGKVTLKRIIPQKEK